MYFFMTPPKVAEDIVFHLSFMKPLSTETLCFTGWFEGHFWFEAGGQKVKVTGVSSFQIVYLFILKKKHKKQNFLACNVYMYMHV